MCMYCKESKTLLILNILIDLSIYKVFNDEILIKLEKTKNKNIFTLIHKGRK